MKSTFVYLTGGLGNQLFQLAAALNSREVNDSKVILDMSLGAPRATKGKADLLHLNIPSNVFVLTRRASLMSRKAAGFLLRAGIKSEVTKKRIFVNFVLQSFSSIIFFIRYRKFIAIFASRDVGYSELPEKTNLLLLGYFQSHRYLKNSKVMQEMFNLVPNDYPRKLKVLIEKASEDRPIFVHVRLTDYLLEEHFGTPSRDYYSRSLARLNAGARSIWVFSDDIDSAKSKLPTEFINQYFYVDDEGLSPAQIFYLLRHGTDYVIANSSFSWWGAALSFHKSSNVIAPMPWFAGMPEPKDLMPTHWCREKV